MKPLVIYHASCLDGYAAAFAAWLKLGADAEYLPLQYGKSEEEWFTLTFCTDDVVSTLDGREVYILDFSLPREHMDYVFKYAKSVVWLDHHKTAFEMWLKDNPDFTPEEFLEQRNKTYVVYLNNGYIKLDNWKSGAMLAWEYFYPRTAITDFQKDFPWAIHFNGYGDDTDVGPGFMEDEDLYTEEHAMLEADRMNKAAIAAGYIPAEGQTRIYEAKLAPESYGEAYSEVPQLFKYIDAYDRGGTFNGWAPDCTEEIQKALWSYAPWTFQQFKWWIEDGPDTLIQFQAQGEAILRAHAQNVQTILDGTTRECCVVIKTKEFGCTSEPGLAANCSSPLVSSVGHELAKKSGTFGLCWHMTKNGSIKVDLRSNGDYDVSMIAKALGGGGHKNAAGCYVDIQTLLGWLQ